MIFSLGIFLHLPQLYFILFFNCGDEKKKHIQNIIEINVILENLKNGNEASKFQEISTI